MSIKTAALCITFAVAIPLAAAAQVPVVVQTDHGALLSSQDARLAANKRIVYDFVREVIEAGHLEVADKYLAENYIQHNPNIPTGRAAFVEAFAKRVKPQPIEPRVRAPLVAILSDGDLVVLAMVREGSDPKDPTQRFTTTWFDMYRIDNGGKIVEHWDPATKTQ